MPRQTPGISSIQFPDGFRIEVSTDGTTGAVWQDLGVIEAGGTATLNWTDFEVDAGNYEGLVDKARDPRVSLSTSPLLNWDASVIAAAFPGFLSTSSATSPTTGDDVTYAGTSNQVSLTFSKVRLTHYTVDATGGTETDSDIDWQFTLHNAKVDAGGSFNFKGMNEDGLDAITVSFTGKPDPASSYALFTFFKA